MKSLSVQGAFADRIRFQEEPHATLLDGVPVAGVSKILNACGIVETWDSPPGFAAMRGTYIHEAIAYHLRDELDLDTLDDSIRGYFDAAMQFLADTGLEPIYVEQPVVASRDLIFDGTASEHLVYGGNLDFFGRYSPSPGTVLTELVDWKSGRIGGERYQAQIGAYWKALRNTALQCGIPIATPQRLTLVQLKENGKYKMNSHDVRQSVALWDRCMDAYIEKGI